MVLLFLGGQISYRWDHLPTHSFSVLVKHLLLNGLRQDGAHALVRVVLLYVPFAGKQCGRTYQRIFHDLVWGEWFVFCILWPCARCALPRPYPTYEPILGAYGWLGFCISWYMFVYLGHIWIYLLFWYICNTFFIYTKIECLECLSNFNLSGGCFPIV